MRPGNGIEPVICANLRYGLAYRVDCAALAYRGISSLLILLGALPSNPSRSPAAAWEPKVLRPLLSRSREQGSRD